VAELTMIIKSVSPRQHGTQVEKTLTCVGPDCRYSRSYLEPYTDFSVDLVDPSAAAAAAAAAAAGAGADDALLLSLEEEQAGGNPLQAFDLLAHCFQEQVVCLFACFVACHVIPIHSPHAATAVLGCAGLGC
jgi:hypothetical protein